HRRRSRRGRRAADQPRRRARARSLDRIPHSGARDQRQRNILSARPRNPVRGNRRAFRIVESMRRNWVLTATILASSMAFIDGSVVSIALPVMQKLLSATMTDAQWIVDAYALVLASLLLAG